MKKQFSQTSLKPGTEATDYKEPDHSTDWPGRQTPTRQLSLLDMVPRQQQARIVDLTPSPCESPRPQLFVSTDSSGDEF